MANTDRRGKHWNQIDDQEVNRGNHSKLNQDQLKERFEFHAQRFSCGRPTIQQICDHWYTKYKISIAYGSEKEWAWRNETGIIDTMNRMLEEGKLTLSITDHSLLNTVNISGLETGKTLKMLEQKMSALIRSINWDLDPLKELGIDQLIYQAMDPNTRALTDYKIKVIENKNKLRLKMLPEISCMIKDHKKVLLDTINTTKGLFDDSNLKNLKVQHEVQKQIGKHMGKNEQDNKFNPIEVEVLESDRRKVLKED